MLFAAGALAVALKVLAARYPRTAASFTGVVSRGKRRVRGNASEKDPERPGIAVSEKGAERNGGERSYSSNTATGTLPVPGTPPMTYKPHSTDPSENIHEMIPPETDLDLDRDDAIIRENTPEEIEEEMQKRRLEHQAERDR